MRKRKRAAKRAAGVVEGVVEGVFEGGVDNQQKRAIKEYKVDNQHKQHHEHHRRGSSGGASSTATAVIEPRRPRTIPNWLLASIAVAFTITSLMANYLIYSQVEPAEETTGRVTDTGAISLCINAMPILGSSCSIQAPVGRPYYCRVNYTDRDNVSISFFDDASIFDVNSTGEVNLTPAEGDIGYNEFNVSMNDGSGCSNAQSQLNFTLNIENCIEPAWDEFKNHLTTNFSNQTCWSSMRDVGIGIPHLGQINYSGSVLNLNNVSLDDAIEIGYNNITVYGTLASVLNVSSTNLLYNLTFASPAVLLEAEACPAGICSIGAYSSDRNLTFTTTQSGSYTTVEGANLSTWDSTDNATTYVQSEVVLYGSYRYSNGSTVDDGSCNTTINDRVNGRDVWEGPFAMSLNATSELFEYYYTFGLGTQGTRAYNITCINADNLRLTVDGEYQITNRLPVLISSMPNETWEENTDLSGRDLDDYFQDPDQDILNFTTTSIVDIAVVINNDTHRITLRPGLDFVGTRTVVYIGTDPFNASALSNIVTLTVVAAPEPEAEEEAAGGEGGAGGGGTSRACIEYWDCGEWQSCLPSNIRIRRCTDLADCGTNTTQPHLLMSCDYVPTCTDLIRNGLEEGVDCGGLCKPCPTCTDRIQNQGEEGIDCGGPCPRSCEEAAVAEEEAPSGTVLAGARAPFWWLLLIVVALLGSIIGYRFRKSIREYIGKAGARLMEKHHRKQEREDRKHELREQVKAAQQEAASTLRVAKTQLLNKKKEDAHEQFASAANAFLRNIFGIGIDAKQERLAAAMRKLGLRGKLVEDFTSFIAAVHTKRYSGTVIDEAQLRKDIVTFEKYARKIALKLGSEKVKTKMEHLTAFMDETQHELKAGNLEAARISYSNAMAVYKTLSHSHKTGSYPELHRLYEHIREESLKAAARSVKRHIAAVLLIIGIAGMAGLGFFIMNAGFTGFTIFGSDTAGSSGPLRIDPVEDINVIIGEHVKEQVRARGGVGEPFYSDNTGLFTIGDDGLIEFRASHKDAGSHRVVVIVEDSGTGEYASTGFSVNIFSSRAEKKAGMRALELEKERLEREKAEREQEIQEQQSVGHLEAEEETEGRIETEMETEMETGEGTEREEMHEEETGEEAAGDGKGVEEESTTEGATEEPAAGGVAGVATEPAAGGPESGPESGPEPGEGEG